MPGAIVPHFDVREPLRRGTCAWKGARETFLSHKLRVVAVRESVKSEASTENEVRN